MEETLATNTNVLIDQRIRTPTPPTHSLPDRPEWLSKRARLALAQCGRLRPNRESADDHRQAITPRGFRSREHGAVGDDHSHGRMPREFKWISKRARLAAAQFHRWREIEEAGNDQQHRRKRYSDCTELKQREDVVFRLNGDAVLSEVSVATGIATPRPSRDTCRSSSIPWSARSTAVGTDADSNQASLPFSQRTSIDSSQNGHPITNEDGNRNLQENLSGDPLVVGVASLLRQARLNQGMLPNRDRHEIADMLTEFEPIDYSHVARLRVGWNMMPGIVDEERTTLGTRSPSALTESQSSPYMSLVANHDEDQACDDEEE